MGKQEQRAQALRARDRLRPAQREAASRVIAKRATALPELRSAHRICCFVSFRTEVSTRPIMDWILRTGRELVVPRIVGPRQMEAVTCGDPDADLVPGRWQIPEPHVSLPACPPESIDALLVPGAAFDPRGGRIGYGGGFYDNFLPRLRPDVPRIALAFEAQILPAVEVEPHDLLMDTIVTEERVIRVPFSRKPHPCADIPERDKESDSGNMTGRRPPLLAIVAKSGSGKTTFIEKLLPELQRLGLRVGTVKHDAHDFEIDQPGKDSYRHGAAGAEAYVISSAHRLAFVARQEHETPLVELARRFLVDLDLVIVEGYKQEAPHKIELFRSGAGHAAPLYPPSEVLAYITDDPGLQHQMRFGLDDAAEVAAFIAARLELLRRY